MSSARSVEIILDRILAPWPANSIWKAKCVTLTHRVIFICIGFQLHCFTYAHGYILGNTDRHTDTQTHTCHGEALSPHTPCMPCPGPPSSVPPCDAHLLALYSHRQQSVALHVICSYPGKVQISLREKNENGTKNEDQFTIISLWEVFFSDLSFLLFFPSSSSSFFGEGGWRGGGGGMLICWSGLQANSYMLKTIRADCLQKHIIFH